MAASLFTAVALGVLLALSCTAVLGQFTGGNGRNWCCKVDADEPKPITQTSTIVLYEKQTVATKVGYTGCGTWGTDRCSIYAARYKAVQKYATSYRQTALFRDCPEKHIVCCSQHSLVAGQCIHHNTVNDHIEDIEFLHGLGVLDAGKK